jgi:hypothetical protein
MTGSCEYSVHSEKIGQTNASRQNHIEGVSFLFDFLESYGPNVSSWLRCAYRSIAANIAQTPFYRRFLLGLAFFGQFGRRTYVSDQPGFSD